ncbi:MAG: flagellar filament capping protein FliD [Pseudomonadota bacterium]
MASITSAGLGSGLDINGIISSLMAVEAQPLTALATKEASYQSKLSAFGSLKGALSSLQTAAQTLKNASTFTAKSASSSDSTVLAASASSTAAAGSYSITVNHLAGYHALRSDGNYTATTDIFNTGTLSIAVGGGTAVNVDIDSNNNTLAGIRDAINEADAGVTASIIYDSVNAKQRLVLTSQTLGSDGAITVAVSNEVTVSGANPLLDLATASLVETKPAEDAELIVNGITTTSSSNSVTDAIDGLTLTLSKAGTTTVTVAQNTGTVTSAVNAFVKAYNDAVGGIKQMTAYDAANKKASVLTGDSTARSIQSQLSNLAQSMVTGVAGGISRLSDIGITVQKDGTLAVDSSKLSAAVADPDKDVAALFTQTTTGNEGIAVRFNTILEGIVGTSGLITSRTDGISASIKDLQKRADALNLRLEQVEKRYRAQFTALDTLIASMNQTSTYLTQQLAALPGAASSE